MLDEKSGGFPGGTVVENLPASAGYMGSSPGLGRSHMPQSNWAREPQLLSLCVWSLCSATREAVIVRGPRTTMKSGPRLPPTRESPRTEMKTQHSHKLKKKKQKQTCTGVNVLLLPFSCSFELAKLVFLSTDGFFAGIFKPGVHFPELVKTQLYSL